MNGDKRITNVAALRLQYHLPEEYDYEMEFTCTMRSQGPKATTEFGIPILFQGKWSSFCVFWTPPNRGKPDWSAFTFVPDKENKTAFAESPVGVKLKEWIPLNKSQMLRLEVRRDKVSVIFNGATLLSKENNDKVMIRPPSDSLLSVLGGNFVFHRISVVEHTSP